METLDQLVPSQQQTLVVNTDQRSTTSELPVSVGETGKLFDTEISVKQVDENGVGDVSVVQVSLSDSGRKMRGRKSKDTIFSNEKAVKENGVQDSGKTTAKRLIEEEEDVDVEEGMVGEGHEFSVGDFVWAKIKSYPWWPGQIYSSSDASVTAAKYKRRNRLLVACFGDKTFAWCYPFQLKPFQENFDQLVKESNSKSFGIAVEEAVNEISRQVDVEMACSCLAVENRPVKTVVMNAGIKEGVAVPAGEIGELSINLFDPAKFLSCIKCIAQTVSIDNMLELVVLRGRLSGFYRAKGYYYLPEYREPMRIFVPSDPVDNGFASEDKGEDQIKNVAGTPEEADWLTASAVPEVGNTGITVSRRLSTMSEDKLLQSKKQRSVADLMSEEKEGNVSTKPRGRPKKGKEIMISDVGSDVAEELAMSGKEAFLAEEGTMSTKARGRPKKRRENTGSDGAKDVAEELAVSGKEALLNEEGTVFTKARGRPKEKRENVDLNMDSEIGGDVAEELTISGKEGTKHLAEEGTISAKTIGRPKRKREILVSEVGSDAAEKLIISGKNPALAEEGTTFAKPSGRPKKTRENKDTEGGVGVTEESTRVRSNVPEEMTASGKQSPLAKEGTMSTRPRGRPKKTGVNIVSEGDTDVATEVIKARRGVAEELTISVKQSPLAEEGTMSTKPRGRPKKTRENTGPDGGTGVVAELIIVRNKAAEEMTISGNQTPLAEEGTTAAKPRGRPRKKKENESEVGDDIDVVKQLPFSGKQSADTKKRKSDKDSVVGKDRGGDGELSEKQMAASGIRKKKVDPELGNNSALVEEGSVNGEHALSPNKSPNVDKDGFSTKERSNSSSSLRERKKSKYLSPPYMLLSQSKKNGIVDNDSKKKTSNISSNSIGGETFQREQPKESSPKFSTSGSFNPLQPNESQKTTKECYVSAHEILSDFRSAALDPLYLTKKQSDDSMKGFFTKFRSSLYQDGSDFTVHNNQLAGRGNRKRVSFDIKSGLPGNTESESGHPISEGESERKKSKRKEGELSPNTSVAVLLITFAPGASLPSKDALITTFSPFGALKESETEVMEDSGCARVVFANRSEAEDAYKNSDKISSFGSSVVSYRLRYVPVVSRASDNVESPHTDHPSSSLPVNASNAPIVESAKISEVPPLQSVRQNLQMATSALENSWDKLSSDLKASLDTEIKGFLSKVTSMVESSSF